MGGIVVTLGAGHGGYDLGTVGPSGFTEKDFNWYAISLAARRLTATGRFDPVPVRAGDWYADAAARARMAVQAASRCHVELHADLQAASPKGAAVWFSADRPGDRLPAARLSRRIAQLCRVPDCGARPRYEFGSLLTVPAGIPDMYALIETLARPAAGPDHVFFCECGILPAVSGSERRLRRLAARLAEAVAREICRLFGVPAGVPPRPPQGEIDPWSPAFCPVRLHWGLFYARAGPGPRCPAVGIVQGGGVTDCLAEENGWFAVPGGLSPAGAAGRIYLSRLALAELLRPAPAAPVSPPETTRRDGFSLVLTEPRPGAAILGALGPGTRLPTRRQPGYRQIVYGDRAGFVGDDAFGGR